MRAFCPLPHSFSAVIALRIRLAPLPIAIYQFLFKDLERLNHSPAYIRRDLFNRYGLYDETLRICSDWKFYVQSLVLGGESVEYADIDMTLFDMTGISETNKDLLNNERNRLLQELIPIGILKDYDEFHFPMIQYRRLKKYHLWGVVYFIERMLFKLEKWRILK